MRDVVDQRYRVEQKLAVGGFGAIYRATDLVIGRQVALKILHRELATDANVVARFRRETATLARLKCSHTLTLYDVGETEDTLYFVTELLRGESLLEVLERTGPLPWRRVAHIMRGVCSSLREAHALGIIHRDLKPANIFIEQHALSADFVKVLDFGIAKIVGDKVDVDNRELTSHGQMIGTFDYMAPEQMVGRGTTAASDMFTLGVVMYELMTGAHPFGEANGPAQMLMSLLNTTPAPLTGVPPALARGVMKCLSREPKDRPDIEELDDVLARVLEVEEAAFGDDDGPTLLSARPPRPRTPSPAPRVTLVRGSVTPQPLAPELRETELVDTVAAARDAFAASQSVVATPVAPTNVARGSEAAITPPRGSHVDIAYEATWSGETPTSEVKPFAAGTDGRGAKAVRPGARPFAAGTDADGAPVKRVAVHFKPTPTPTDAQSAPRGRLAVGTASPNTSPLSDASAATNDQTIAPRMATRSYVFYAVLAGCLFGAGFLGAFALWSL